VNLQATKKHVPVALDRWRSVLLGDGELGTLGSVFDIAMANILPVVVVSALGEIDRVRRSSKSSVRIACWYIVSASYKQKADFMVLYVLFFIGLHSLYVWAEAEATRPARATLDHEGYIVEKLLI
jgi:hypothetical protein